MIKSIPCLQSNQVKRTPQYFISFCLKQGIFSWTINSLRDSVDQAVNSFVIANGLNKNEFRYLLLSYTGYGFWLNVLNRLSKIGILS